MTVNTRETEMKKSVWILAVLLLAGSGAAFAHEMDEPEGKSATITGEVVDLACYLGDGDRGPKHQQCAQKCIESGLPVGIKTADALYLVIGGEHGPANKDLAPLAAKTVTAEGTVSERDGVHLIAVKKVAPKTA